VTEGIERTKMMKNLKNDIVNGSTSVNHFTVTLDSEKRAADRPVNKSPRNGKMQVLSRIFQ
jgi:hypothetical protein